jgi:hypothetical protein
MRNVPARVLNQKYSFMPISDSKAPTVYVSAPQGAGKSRHAETLRQLFGCTQIVDEWDGSSAVPAGSLVLTNIAPMRVIVSAADGADATGLWFRQPDRVHD